MSYINANLIANVTYLKNVNWFRLQHGFNKNANRNLENIQELFKSKYFLVVNKPHDLIVYNYKKDTRNMPTLYDYLKEKYPFYYDPRLRSGFHVLHRLDSVTSGVICIPLNYFSQRIAVEAFTSGNTEKYYLALVYGKLESQNENNELIIDVPIGEDLKNYKYARCTSVDKHGNKVDECLNFQKATTKIKVLEYGTYNGRDCSKLLIQPLTGRRHQIRVHLKYAGYPVVGDTCYGIDDYDTYRTMLHSYKLVMKINTKQRMFLKAKAPDPFLNSIDPKWIPKTVVNNLKI